MVVRRTTMSCFFFEFVGFAGAGLSIVAIEICFFSPLILLSFFAAVFLLGLFAEFGFVERSRSIRISSPI